MPERFCRMDEISRTAERRLKMKKLFDDAGTPSRVLYDADDIEEVVDNLKLPFIYGDYDEGWNAALEVFMKRLKGE